MSRKTPEGKVLDQVLDALKCHPKVAIVWRQTVGTFQRGPRWVSVGIKGMPDVMGMLTDGRFFCIEVKAPGGVVDPAQWQWLELVSSMGGVSGVTTDVPGALRIIES